MAYRLLTEHRRFIELLNQYQVAYMVIGGVAVNLHGYSRGTGDLDILFESTSANIHRLASAIEAYGYETTRLRSMDPRQIIMFALGERNYNGHIELTNRIARFDYQKAARQRRVANVDEVELYYMDLEDLLANKIASGRPRDLNDVAQLQKIRQWQSAKPNGPEQSLGWWAKLVRKTRRIMNRLGD